MAATIVNILTAQYDLVAGGNPLTITDVGGVEVPGSTAIYGSAAQAWTITNAGTLTGTRGISLKAGGTITNTGSILATATGVSLSGGRQSVGNSGTIRGSNDGVALLNGSLGVVTNLAGGIIAGGANVGVYLKDTSNTVVNAGTIIGNAGAQAIQFVGSGTDLLIVDPGAVFVGVVQGGSGTNTLELAQGSGGRGTLSGLSTQFLGFGTIGVDLGASWSLANAGTRASGTTLSDSGTLSTSGTLIVASGAAVTIAGTGTLLGTGTLDGAGSLFNHGRILANGAIAVSYLFNNGTIGASAKLTDAGTLVNQGTIAAGVTLASGATLDNGGVINVGPMAIAVYATGMGAPGYSPATVTNSGTIVAYAGILLSSGGRVTNTGSIVGTGTLGGGLAIFSGLGFVSNAGHIAGGPGAGVKLNAGGTITNLAGGVLQGGKYAVEFEGPTTLINAGTIIGSDGVAVAAQDVSADRVVVDPGAVFVGNVEGDPSVGNTLELAPGTGGNAGTLSGLSTQFSGFGTIDIDPGASWSLVNAGTLASGTSLNDSGSLTLAGSVGEGGALTMAGGASGSSPGVGGVLINTGTLGLTGMLELRAGGAARGAFSAGLGAAATNSGTLTNAGTVLLDGGYGGGNGYQGGMGGALTNTGVLINSSLISLGGGGGGYHGGSSGTGGMLLDSGTLTNAGMIALAGGGSKDPNLGPAGGYGAGLVVSGTLINSGTIGIAAGYTGGAGPGYAAALTITGTLSGAGTVNGAGSLFNHGSILAGGAIDVGYLFNDGTIGASATLTDAGTLVNQGGIATGVTLASGATLENSGSITTTEGSGHAVYSAALSPTVINSGPLAGSLDGILFSNGGHVTNLTGGAITGLESGFGGVAIYGQPGFVINAGGSIVGASYAVNLAAGGTISNLAGGVLHGTSGYGAVIRGGAGTVINAGTIVGGGRFVAVAFSGTFTDRLIVDPGAVFTGAVQGGSGSNTLELAQGTSGNAGTISGIGTQFVGFATLAVDTGADWAFDGSNTLGSAVTISDAGTMIFNERAGRTVTVSASLSGSGSVVQSGPGRLVLNGADSFSGGVTLAGGTLELSSGNGAAGHGIYFAGAGTVRFDGLPAGTIYSFANTDTIDLPSYSYVSGAQANLAAGNTLVVQSGAATFDLLLDPTQDFSGVMFSVQQDAATGILVEETSAPCYAHGTHLLTAEGEVAIEALRIGDLLVTASGALRPVRWIGLRSYVGRTIAGNRDILPIRLHAGALADGVPCRDLDVSPKHAMFLDGVLIPAERLVNGVSIVQLEQVDALTYYHVELDSHDVLIAEGALSESFIDHDSRVMFQNAAAFSRLHPARMEDCAPRVEDGEVLAQVRQRLAARVGLQADHADDAAMEGPLDGRIDLLDESQVAGWAFDARRPHTPVWLDILEGDRVIGTMVANRFRPDLRPAGKGDGRCAYVFRFDTKPADLREISLRRSSDGAMLPAPAAMLRAA